MSQKMEMIKQRIDEMKKEREELREKYDYLVEQMKKTLDKNSQDIISLKNELKSLTGKEDRGELKMTNLGDTITSLKKAVARTESKYTILRDKLMEESKLTGKKLDTEISEKIKNIRLELVDDLKKEIDRSSSGVHNLGNEVKKLQVNDEKHEQKISNTRSLLNTLDKSISELDGRQSVMKEKFKEEISLAKDELNSEITGGMKTVQGRLVNDIKKELDKSLEDLLALGKDISRMGQRHEGFEEKISSLRSGINALAKSLNKVEGKYSVLKEKVANDMKAAENEINSRLTERMKAMDISLKTQVKDAVKKNLDDIRLMKEDVKGTLSKSQEYDKRISKTAEEINSIRKSISGLDGGQGVLKDELNGRVNLLEKEITSEMAKIKGFEERMTKDIEDFEKFASNQKARRERFESKISDKIDMFAMVNENLKKDLSSLGGQFSNINNRLDSMKDKDSEISEHLKTAEMTMQNAVKTNEEAIMKLREDHSMFKENLVAKLNETSAKIISRLSQKEIKSASDIAKQSEEIKLFRAHVTQFINDLVSNYEKRFEMMKAELDQTLRIIQERSREQKAMIFE